MKKSISILYLLICIGKISFSQNNAIKGFILGFTSPTSITGTYSLGYEYYTQNNQSIEFNFNGYLILGEGSGLTNSCILGYRLYKDTKRKLRNKLWISPHIGVLHSNLSEIDYNYEYIYYNLGCTIGKRIFFKNEKLFWDIGLGFSYGLTNYISYYFYIPQDNNPAKTSKKNEFRFYPRITMNFGIKY